MTAWLLVPLLCLAPGQIDRLIRHTTDGLDKQRPAWSPDGRTLAFARHERGGQRIHQYLVEPDDPDSLRRLTPDRDDPTFWAVFRPTDGQTLLLAVISFSGTQGNIDIASIRRDSTDLKVIARDPQPKLSFQDWPAWAPDGDQFAFSSTHEGNQEIYLAKADGSEWRRLTQHPGIDAHPCFTPDGHRLVFATDRWGGFELASMNRDGTDVRRLTQSPGLDDYPAVSPDGRRIAFVSNRDGNFEVYVIDIDGSNPINLSRNEGRDTHPTWTPDGRGVTFVSERDGGVDIYTARLAEPEP
jgi:TolB protein